MFRAGRICVTDILGEGHSWGKAGRHLRQAWGGWGAHQAVGNTGATAVCARNN